MTIVEAKTIIELLGKQFDSHEFIRRFIYTYPSSYGKLLQKYNNVSTAHGEIANFLRRNAGELNIERLDKEESNNILGNESLNVQWGKR